MHLFPKMSVGNACRRGTRVNDQLEVPAQPTPRARGVARRRLIKGFAAPATLTLFSGGALAATSLPCLARAAGTRADPTLTNLTYLRVQAHVGGNPSAANYSAWISSSEINQLVQLLNPNATSFLSAGLYINVAAGNGTANSTGFVPGATTSALPTGVSATPNGPFYALLFDVNGNVVAIATSSSSAINSSGTYAGTGGVATKSCYGSFIGA